MSCSVVVLVSPLIDVMSSLSEVLRRDDAYRDEERARYGLITEEVVVSLNGVVMYLLVN